MMRKKYFTIGVNFNSKRDVNTYELEGDSINWIIHQITPQTAVEVMESLKQQMEWYKHPLYQWAKKKTGEE